MTRFSSNDAVVTPSSHIWLITPFLMAIFVPGCARKEDLRYSTQYVQKDEYHVTLNRDGREVPSGSVRRYDRQGRVIINGHYKHGILDGAWEYFDEHGKLRCHEMWKNGQLIAAEGERILDYSGFGLESKWHKYSAAVTHRNGVRREWCLTVVFQPVPPTEHSSMSSDTMHIIASQCEWVLKMLGHFSSERLERVDIQSLEEHVKKTIEMKSEGRRVIKIFIDPLPTDDP